MFVRTSLILPVPVANASVIPVTAALDQVITVLPVVGTVRLVAVYVNVVPLQIAAGVNVEESAGVGLTVAKTSNADPTQLPDVGVTEYVIEIAAFVELTKVPDVNDVAALPLDMPERPVAVGALHV